ncbi:membrane protein [Paractinoplanes deccanensis]|uniref:Membrane protein n=1 Tax=Paractinoplanes deccanensis TaxID=113561 RepID=A0ABQ3Y8F8_9ACTN|nr:hypothetical protein [Actinoplanes deccanensis]GID76267.1 membrane protein [Actinoplanes deccanensis]
MRRNAITLGVLIAVAVVAVQALLIPLFSAPAANLEPRDLPIAVAGPPALAAQLQAARPGAFDITTVPDAAAADAAIKDRDVYGAILVTAAGPEVHIASGGSPTVATLLSQAATALPTQPAGAGGVVVKDVVPLDADDPRGAGFAAAFLPLAITSLAAGFLVFLLLDRRAARVTALVAYGVFAGLGAAAVQQLWLGIVPGDYLAVAGALGLFAFGMAAAVAGLAALLGEAGVGLGALIFFLVGNAISGVAAAPELLPQPWGAVGQWLPIGAGGSLLRSAAYFDGGGAGLPVAVLTAYGIGGLLLVLIGRKGLASAKVAAVGETAASPAPVPAG